MGGPCSTNGKDKNLVQGSGRNNIGKRPSDGSDFI